MPPGACQRRQTGHRPHRIAAATHTLHAVVQADGCGLGGAPIERQLPDLRCRHATHIGGAFGRPLQCPRAQAIPAQGVAVDVIGVEPVVHDQFVHQGQRQRGIGAGSDGDVLVTLFGRFSAPWVDADQLGALAFGLLGDAPEMQVAADRVAAPNHDEFGFGKKLDLHAHLVAQGLGQGLCPGRGANRAVQQRSTQLVKKPPGNRFALHMAHGAGIAVGLHRLGVAGGNGFQTVCNGIQRLVPAHGLELPRTLGAHPPQRL